MTYNVLSGTLNHTHFTVGLTSAQLAVSEIGDRLVTIDMGR